MDQEKLKQLFTRNVLANAHAFIVISWVRYLSYRCNRFMKGLCPRQKMSCIGLRPRNMLTLTDSYMLTISWATVLIMNVLLISFFQKYGHTFSPYVAFLLHDMFWCLSFEGHNIIIIFYLFNKEIPFVEETVPRPQFYQKLMIIEPRRENYQYNKLTIFKKLWKDKTMWDKEVLQISQGTSSELNRTRTPVFLNCYRPSFTETIPMPSVE